MSVRVNLPVEYGMTHRVGLGGLAERYERPDPVRAMAQRMLRWTSEPETCQNCHSLPAIGVRSGLPLCSRCAENRGVRFVDPVGVRPRAAFREDDADGAQLRGHAIVFNSRSVDLGGFIEIIKPSAADRLEAEKPDVRALWSHDSGEPLGRVSAGTLRVRKVRSGVAFELDPPRAAHGRVEAVRRRDVSGMSFGFSVIEDEWKLQDGYPLRSVVDMDIFEISVVSFPAYEATHVQLVNPGARSAWQIEAETKERLRLAR